MALTQEADRASGRELGSHLFLSVTPGGQDKGVWKALLSAFIGVLIAGVIMTLASYGVVAAFGFLV